MKNKIREYQIFDNKKTYLFTYKSSKKLARDYCIRRCLKFKPLFCVEVDMHGNTSELFRVSHVKTYVTNRNSFKQIFRIVQIESKCDYIKSGYYCVHNTQKFKLGKTIMDEPIKATLQTFNSLDELISFHRLNDGNCCETRKTFKCVIDVFFRAGLSKSPKMQNVIKRYEFNIRTYEYFDNSKTMFVANWEDIIFEYEYVNNEFFFCGTFIRPIDGIKELLSPDDIHIIECKEVTR